MSENRFWFVIDKGKLEYVQDLVNNEKINVSELEDLLNELATKCSHLKEENEQLQCNHKKAIIGFLKFMNMDNPLMEIMIDEFLEEVYDGD